MRIRSIRPDFWTSTDIGDLDIATRLLFVGLWSYVDDNGVGRDVEALIASELFPFDMSRDSRECLARVSEGLQRLSEGGQITRYTDAGKPYLFVVGWDKHQKIDKPGRPRYPRPTRENSVIREPLAKPSRDFRETPSPGEGEKGRRGEGEKEEEPPVLLADERADVESLCEHLAANLVANGCKPPRITKAWRDAARLLIDKDGHTEAQVHACIDWTTADDFWRANVLSMPKLREKYDQLRLAAERSNRTPTNRRQQETDELFARAAERLTTKTNLFQVGA